MTKINENGQLEWTFEELDLEGALLLVQDEYEHLRAVMVCRKKDSMIFKECVIRCNALLDVSRSIRSILGWMDWINE